MKEKFFVGKGRYKSLADSRYMGYTYGKKSFAGLEADLKKKDHGPYGSLLFDKRWITRRKEILTRDHHCCVICRSSENLQVHHRQYHYIKALDQFKAPWDYDGNLMITLCEKCHSRGHSKFRIPSILI